MELYASVGGTPHTLITLPRKCWCSVVCGVMVSQFAKGMEWRLFALLLIKKTLLDLYWSFVNGFTRKNFAAEFLKLAWEQQ